MRKQRDGHSGIKRSKSPDNTLLMVLSCASESEKKTYLFSRGQLGIEVNTSSDI